MATSVFQLFRGELDNPSTNYFIFDTYGEGKHDDIDFVQYGWTPAKYNLVKERDLFLYRRPAKHSETKEFYLFGACKIGEITGHTRCTATFSKKCPLMLLQSDLEDFKWEWKDRGDSWANFFNQYGMNKIPRQDFVNLLKLADRTEGEWEETNPDDEVEAVQAIQNGNYFVDDQQSYRTIRSKQKAFADRVKLNYKCRCAVCGIKTRDFLVASHIIPWSKRKDSRLDPANGICLCVFHDRAFDYGYLSIAVDYRIQVSPALQDDSELRKYLELWHEKKIKLPNKDKPNKEYLEYHRDNVFRI